MKEPKVVGCNCFQGYRGMDRCHHCDGTGSRFFAAVGRDARYFPNTEDGWKEAVEFMNPTEDRHLGEIPL